MNVRLIAITQPDPEACPQAYADPKVKPWEALMVYAARVSSPKSQADGHNPERLLRYCLEHGHVSIFETASMTVEITTSRAISAQILRHRSFTFQEFSQRYAEATGFETYQARRQDSKNRQSSHDDLDEGTRNWFRDAQAAVHAMAGNLYDQALEFGIAKESARFLLPLSTTTRLYMTGSVRSWVHYLQTRRAPETQAEHREIAEAIWEIFRAQFPLTAAVLHDSGS